MAIIKSVRQLALRDISKHVKAQRNAIEANRLAHESYLDGGFDNWVVGAVHIETANTSRLNRVLGLHKINK